MVVSSGLTTQEWLVAAFGRRRRLVFELDQLVADIGGGVHREPCHQCGRAGVRHPAPAAPGSATTWQLASWVWDPGLVMGSAPGGQQAGPARAAVLDRRRELGAFLRSRRARLRPAEVGLADWGVRRVPGLRQEEVAQLANVGLTWYTWLEQGRQARPSASVLTAIADALRLDAHEREHLFALARDPEDQARGWEDHTV